MRAGDLNVNSSERLTGGLMSAAAILSVLVMAHHPTGGGDAALANGVHGALMALNLIILTGFFRFAAREGLERFSAAAGIVLYSAGAFGNLLAATINGFAVPALAARGASNDVFAFAWEINQALAYGAVFAISAAFTLWGLALARNGSRLVAAAGLAAGVLPAALLASGALDMHVAGAAVIYAGQSAFGVIIGVRMALRKT